ncbi:MAG TPA: hypothetical protein VHC22_09840 [Pirellulales bacterium]|nr:hypothetical protein [Pirellulales bacterium]
MISQERFNDDATSSECSPDDDPVARLRLQLNELQAYVLQHWAARTDRFLLGLRRLAILAVAAVVAMVGLVAWIVMGVVLLLQGATGGLATLLDGRVWLANLIVGGGAVLLVALGIAAAYGAWRAASKQRTRQKYEERQRVQRRQYGHSAHDRASGQ